jgi:RimJ/RimL family protein N-acetyltransferase
MREGKKVRLRSLKDDDIMLMFQWINDPEVIRFTNNFKPVSEAEQRVWFQSQVDQKNQIVLGIEVKTEKKLIGSCGLYAIERVNRKAEVRIKIGNKSYWGRGYGREAMELLLEFAFDDLNLRRLWLKVLPTNISALKLYKNIGFEEEGILRQDLYIQGKYHDLIVMGLLRENTKK